MDSLLYKSPFGNLLLEADDDYLTQSSWSDQAGVESSDNPVLLQAKQELDEYFAGNRRSFDVPLSVPVGSELDGRVLDCLSEIPYGEVRTYGELARAAGNPGAARRVGTIMRENSLPVFLPCHRVVPASGGIGAYAGEEDDGRKSGLLALEAG